MATRAKYSTDGVKSINKTFETVTADSTVIQEKLFRPSAVDDDDDDDGPVVFFCSKCKLPVGDSMSWEGTQHKQSHIHLKRVTNNVLVGKDTRLHEAGKGSLCLIVDLVCAGCHTVLGMIYKSTPKNLDHMRATFCVNVAHIDSYVLGSSCQKSSAEGADEQPLTLEYRGRVEQMLNEMKTLVVSMAQHVQELERAAAQDEV
ncbi:protein Mis18-alpha [Vanacampus margaritifer]